MTERYEGLRISYKNPQKPHTSVAGLPE